MTPQEKAIAELERRDKAAATDEAPKEVASPKSKAMEELARRDAEKAKKLEEESLTLKKAAKQAAKGAVRFTGQLGRIGVSGLAGIGDLPAMAGNLALWGAEKAGAPKMDIPYPSAVVKEGFDKLTGDRFKPKGGLEEMFHAVGENLTPMGGVGAAVKLGKNVPAILKKIYTPTRANVVGNATGTALGDYVGRTTENPLIGFLGSVLGGVAGQKVAGIRPSQIKSSIHDGRANAAVRNRQVESETTKNLPVHYNAPNVGDDSLSRAGQDVLDVAKNYQTRARSIHARYYEEAGKHMTPEHEMISMTPVSNWFFGELGKLKSPERKEAFLKTPVARQYFKALGLPENATHEMLRQAVDKSPDLLHKNYHWSDMHDIKKEVGNTLSTKAWNQIGTSDEKGLRLLQGSLGENLRNAFESVSPEAGKAWNRYNSSYEKYAKTKKPSINRIIADVSDPEHAYHAAKGEMDKGGRTFRFALENAKGTQKENIARTFIAEVGDTGKNFSIEKFGPAWDKVPRKVRNMALAALPEEESGRIKDMMKVYDRMQEVVTHDKTGWDFGNRQHGMGVSAFVKKAALRAVTGPHWRGPEGQKHIREAMLHGHQKAPPTGESVKEFAAKSTPRMLAQLFANRLKDS